MRMTLCAVALCCLLEMNGQSWQRSMLHLPDTGQEQSFTSLPGEDSDIHLFPLSYAVHNDGTLTDEVTGLMWQITDGGEMTFENAIAYCDTLQLAGYGDWRLPSAHELMSIQDLQASNPSVDTQSFAATNAEYWWSADAQVNDPNKIWVTNAGGGIGNHPKSETLSAGGTHRFHVRAVRALNQPIVLPTRFVVNGDGTVTDAMTDLIWQALPSPDSLTWEEALTHADTASLAGFTDWRLPNVKELHSINQENIVNPSIDPQWNGMNEARKWWSSTTLLNDPQKAWYLYSRFGITTYDLKTIRHFVLLVRGGDAMATTGVTDIPDYEFYPNPATDVLYSANKACSTLEVFDMNGKLMDTLHGCGRWSLETLAPGAYLITGDWLKIPRLLIVH